MTITQPGLERVRRNAPTFAIALAPQPRVALSPRASFLLAYDRMSLLASASSERSVVVTAVDASGQVTAALRVFDRHALVVGRHEQCGLRLPAETVALRHAAVLVHLEGESARVLVRDLATQQPFVTEDGQVSAGVTAEGPLYLAIGEYALWFVPSEALAGRRAAEDVWSALPPRTFLEHHAVPSVARPAAVLAPTRDLARRRVTCVTQMGPPLLLDDGDAPEVSWGVLRLESGTRKEKRWVSAERLEQGILLGRYSRCSVLVDALESTTSRVHALLLRLGADVWVIDLASTNGVWRDGASVKADVLRDHDRLVLGRQVTLDWTRTLHAEA